MSKDRRVKKIITMASLFAAFICYPVVMAQNWDEYGSIADDRLIFSNYASGDVSNGGTGPEFNLDQPHTITLIRTYHWNNGQGQAPGSIGFRDQNGKMYGPWSVTYAEESSGVPNVYWVVSGYNPDGSSGGLRGDLNPLMVDLPAGTYTVVDSDTGTWSYNSGSGGRGIAWVYAMR
jgi:hypothetical protein